MSTQDERIKAIGDKFKADMQKLGLGVSIQVGDGPMVKIVDAPDEKTKAKEDA